MGLALYRARVRSNEVLERTCHPFPKPIESLASLLSGGCPSSVTPDRRAIAEAATEDAAGNTAAQHRLP
jgi:hypothetical protein